MAARRKLREAIASALYQIDLTNEESTDKIIEEVYEEKEIYDADDRIFVTSLINGVTENLPKIDETISNTITNITIDRLGYMERAIMRLGVYEILFDKYTPGKVAINEAIELTKTFCDEKSVPFVNASLDNILKSCDDSE